MRKRFTTIISKICIEGLTFGIGFFLGGKILVKMINEYKSGLNRSFANMKVFNSWLSFLYSGGTVEEYFEKHDYNRVMIYGYGYVGKILFQALKRSDIKVIAIMDREVSSNENCVIIGTDSKIPDVDVIIVTPVLYFDEIYCLLREKACAPIVSIEDIFEMDNEKIN